MAVVTLCLAWGHSQRQIQGINDNNFAQMLFFTGTTGFLGGQLLGRFLTNEPSLRVRALIRSQTGEAASQRLPGLLKSVFGPGHYKNFLSRVSVVSGSLSKPNFGLSQESFDQLAAETTAIVHSAASVSFTEPLPIARATNVEGTRAVLKLAERCHQITGRRCPIHYISTAFVAGNTRHTVSPDELKLGGAFRNSYEQSKAEAEALVRDYADLLPTYIYRPSIIVGDSISGQTSAFNVIYGPAKLIASGLLRVLPGNPAALFDIVPVDYVADAVYTLSKNPSNAGRCFHICSGVGREASLEDLLDALVNSLDRCCRKRLPLPEFITAEMFNIAHSSINVAFSTVDYLEKLVGRKIKALDKVAPYFEYLHGNPRFDTYQTECMLKDSLGVAPHFRDYGQCIFDYCFQTQWGKKTWRNPAKHLNWFERKFQ